MNEIKRFIDKEIQKKYLEIFFILDQIARKENIISFSYDHNYLLIQTGVNDYYRIRFNEEVN